MFVRTYKFVLRKILALLGRGDTAILRSDRGVQGCRPIPGPNRRLGGTDPYKAPRRVTCRPSDRYGRRTVYTHGWRIGDINEDGAVNLDDYNILASSFNTTDPASPADLNGDGQVGLDDFNLLAGQFGQALAPADPLLTHPTLDSTHRPTAASSTAHPSASSATRDSSTTKRSAWCSTTPACSTRCWVGTRALRT